MSVVGPRTPNGDYVHGAKYRGEGEDFREAASRVAFGLKDSDSHYHELREIFLDMRFLPGGRIQSAVGATRQTTPYNCFVSGTIADSFVHGEGSIMQRAHEAASTMRMGGGIGYDFSTLRPRGAAIKKLQSQATGPVSFMRIFNEVCLCTSSSGHRRGAQMGVLCIDHPDIEEFVRAKQNVDKLTGFNISVAVTDEFMKAVFAEESFDLRWGGEVWKTVDASALWQTIMRSTWDWGEPGVLFIDRMNEMNNLHYCETLAATNPCGEQPLPPHGACLLGSFNLVRYLRQNTGPIPTGSARYYFDFDQMKADIPIVVRAMDNVVDRARYPLPAQCAEAVAKRRMGLGVTGLANAGEAVGHAYGSERFLSFEETVLRLIRDESYRASVALAKEKKPFPMFDEERYLTGRFVSTLPSDIQFDISRYGIRNSHLTSIAPTGTISMAADNVSSGIEPVFAFETKRMINAPEGMREVIVEDYGQAFLGIRGKLAAEVTAREHLDVLAVAQRFVDSSVSKTINMTSAMPWSDFVELYSEAYRLGCKGCATFNADGYRSGVMAPALGKAEEGPGAGAGLRGLDIETGSGGLETGPGPSCTVDLATGRRDCG